MVFGFAGNNVEAVFFELFGEDGGVFYYLFGVIFKFGL